MEKPPFFNGLLRGIKDPVFFINDAVSLEKYVKTESFFFAHDAKMNVWLDKQIRSTAVLPIDGKLFPSQSGQVRKHSANVVWYHWQKTNGEKLLRLDRNELVAKKELYTNTGTIHSLLHFIWYCGFKKVVFIGCDGIYKKSPLRNTIHSASGYDSRIQNLSQSSPWNQYDQIRRVQDRLCRVFGFAVNYVGTCTGPAAVNSVAVIPQIAHFTWVGGPLPALAEENIERFRRLHPDWDVRVWIGVPKEMPDDLVKILYSTNGLSMRSDIVRFWLMYEYGGIYLDTDIYTLRNMDELRRYEYFVTFAHKFHLFYVGVIGSPAKSAASEKVLDEIRETFRRRPAGAPRCDYGPDLIKRVQARYPELFTILPKHYFYLIKTHGTAIRFIKSDEKEQADVLAALQKNRNTDGVEPYAIHTSGIPQSMSHPYYTASRSSWEQSTKSADELLRRLPNVAISGVLLGAKEGRFAAYMLGHHVGLHLTMIDQRNLAEAKDSDIDRGEHSANNERKPRANPGRMAVTGTEFAASRRHFIKSEPDKALGHTAGHSFDWIFIQDGIYLPDSESNLKAWVDRLKPGGFIGGFIDQLPVNQLTGLKEAGTRLGLEVYEAGGEIWLLRFSY